MKWFLGAFGEKHELPNNGLVTYCSAIYGTSLSIFLFLSPLLSKKKKNMALMGGACQNREQDKGVNTTIKFDLKAGLLTKDPVHYNGV